MRTLQSNRIDFLRWSMADPEGDAKRRHTLLVVLSFVAVILAFAAVESWYMYRIYYELTPQIEALNGYVQDEDVVADYTRAVELESQLSMLSYEHDNLSSAVAAENSYPEFTKTLYDKVQAAAGTAVAFKTIFYDRTSGTLTLDCNAEQMRSVPAFVTALKETQAFGDAVQYYGERWKTEGGYHFTVYCTVQKGA